ncbi:MAG: hypothetical protein MJE68_03705, partial [Proteobacteria bacterium]|nr:hypothetical protein [Pseudomonadota bacterium]
LLWLTFLHQFCRATQLAIISALQSSRSDFENALNQYISWTPEAATALEDSIRSSPIAAVCLTDQVSPYHKVSIVS